MILFNLIEIIANNKLMMTGGHVTAEHGNESLSTLLYFQLLFDVEKTFHI